MTKALVIAALVSLFWASAAAAKDEKGLPVRVGYFNQSEVACNYATSCREAPPGVEEEFMRFLSSLGQRVAASKNACAGAAELQAQILDWSDGLDAREKLYGPCPARCTTYNFPVILKHATGIAGRANHVDLVLDLRYVYFGADRVVAGPDLTRSVQEELQKLKR